MATFRIEHDRPVCIGCGACAAIHPDRWVMDEGDGKSNVVGAKRLENEQEELDIEEDEFERNKEAADCCPVNCIHIRNKENNERLI